MQRLEPKNGSSLLLFKRVIPPVSSFVGAPLVGALQGKAVQTWDVRNPQELRSLDFIAGGLYTAA